MLLNIAWRNIWRNRRRSLIIIASVSVGTVAILLNDGLSVGMIRQIFDNQIGSFVAHVQIHKKGFNDNKVIQKLVPEPELVESTLNRTPGVVHFSRRVMTFGLVSSALNSSGVTIVGVEPENEARVTTVEKWTMEGRYLGEGKHEIIIGRKLAEKLDVGLGDRLVGMASGIDGDIGAEMFRVVGIFETVSSEFDRAYIFIPLKTAQEMLGTGNNVSEFAIVAKTREAVDSIKSTLQDALGDEYEVLSYADILPLMLAQMELYQESTYIVYVIIGLAMIFGIINTMLMSVFERIREYGVLMAIGMKNSRLFTMILTEAFLLGLLGALVGIVSGLLIMLPMANHGLDLSKFSEGLTSFGSGAVIYPVLVVRTIVESVFILPLIAVAGALYPAVRAVRFEPVRAIRYV